ncbi:MAG: bifunctional diaminohydroxyphosphoribosylaminopyrimidine deaminase/5-amino-6-(5-phosphoribosylamino)uracil reductase RibD [Proteobacteria bacterium]|nr:bifunctional diaminohydroxyphosphoribosylaminopyrimidine deaminase/5-amino-6-(5-phosphoribosylamino)uracil reductase RibD [Desulfobulbaceae bacterium]MBU4153199.1 bifunctional diaminohydroxyphosphoribosylaminopyrimidine deaminase/5-amino-6-(5-phosphoribosylamino)uracil reductase RibD [Pseudomonadota bacterium]
MRLALRQAVRAQGRTSPNPLVGAVIVKDGAVVATGYHRKAGTPHAEINAIAKALPELITGATLYVTLEPCSHYGRTPPCCEAVFQCGISRVVVGMTDPNPLVAGQGIRYLQDRGIEVVSGVLNEDCQRVNRHFCHWITSGKPWVIMKAGLSLDGRIAARSGHSGWITNEMSRRYVHQLRDRVDAILVGIGTALADNPSLTTRLPGRNHRDPLRVVLDRDLRLVPEARMLAQQSTAQTLVCCGPKADPDRAAALEAAGAVVLPIGLGGDGLLNLHEVLFYLGRRQITSVLVEGGSRVHCSFWSQGLVNQVNLFYGPLILGADGTPLISALGLDRVDQAPRLTSIHHRRFGDDLMIEGLVG